MRTTGNLNFLVASGKLRAGRAHLHDHSGSHLPWPQPNQSRARHPRLQPEGIPTPPVARATPCASARTRVTEEAREDGALLLKAQRQSVPQSATTPALLLPRPRRG